MIKRKPVSLIVATVATLIGTSAAQAGAPPTLTSAGIALGFTLNTIVSGLPTNNGNSYDVLGSAINSDGNIILNAASNTGGARNYVVNGVMSGGFALVAWPVQYAATGVMTFMVNQDGIVFEKDLGSGTGAVAEKVTTYDPDQTWQPIR